VLMQYCSLISLNKTLLNNIMYVVVASVFCNFYYRDRDRVNC